MKLDIRNHSSMTGIEEVAKKLYKFAQEQLGFDKPARVVFESQGDRAVDMFSSTGSYNPQTKTITIFVDHRHPKDILRSMAHELIHHAQCCKGAFEGQIDTSPGYAQKDDRMRDLERDAYFWGNGILFRDWEDNHKQKRSWDLMNENKKMSLNEQKLRRKVRRMIMETLQEQEDTGPNVRGTLVDQQVFSDAFNGAYGPKIQAMAQSGADTGLVQQAIQAAGLTTPINPDLVGDFGAPEDWDWSEEREFGDEPQIAPVQEKRNLREQEVPPPTGPSGPNVRGTLEDLDEFRAAWNGKYGPKIQALAQSGADIAIVQQAIRNATDVTPTPAVAPVQEKKELEEQLPSKTSVELEVGRDRPSGIPSAAPETPSISSVGAATAAGTTTPTTTTTPKRDVKEGNPVYKHDDDGEELEEDNGDERAAEFKGAEVAGGVDDRAADIARGMAGHTRNPAREEKPLKEDELEEQIDFPKRPGERPGRAPIGAPVIPPDARTRTRAQQLAAEEEQAQMSLPTTAAEERAQMSLQGEYGRGERLPVRRSHAQLTRQGQIQEEEKPLKEWYNDQLHEALLKKFKIKK